MKAVVFAYHDIGCTGIEALLEAGYRIQAVFTHADDPGEHRFFGSVAQLCAEHDLPVYSPEDVNHPLWVEHIKAATALIKVGIQEQIADQLQEALGGHLILTGTHQGVAIESIRLPE